MNRWKVAFLSLLVIVLGSLLAVYVLLFVSFSSDRDEQLPSNMEEPVPADYATFTVNTHKEDLNVMIASFIATEEASTDSAGYKVYIDEEVVLETEINAFGLTIPVHMLFDPQVEEDGRLTLYQTSFTVGQIDLPGEAVLRLMEESIDFPPGVHIYAEEGMIKLSLGDIVDHDHMDIHIEQFDLEEDIFTFRLLYIP